MTPRRRQLTSWELDTAAAVVVAAWLTPVGAPQWARLLLGGAALAMLLRAALAWWR